jgi:pimeloyl-[acyl-carrier protein] methyl ester esterase
MTSISSRDIVNRCARFWQLPDSNIDWRLRSIVPTPPPPALVLLPGLDGTGDFFQPLLEALGNNVCTRVVRYPLDGAYDHASCLELARTRLPTDRPYVLLGESFSGPVAIALAAEAPPGLVGLILASTFAVNPRPRLSIILRPLLPRLPFHGTGAALQLSRFLVLGRWITPAIRELHQKILARLPPATVRQRLEAVADCDVRSALTRVGVPVLCLAARHDRLVPRSALLAICVSAPAAHVTELDAPHCLLQCAPREAAATIMEFVHSL